VLEDEPDKIQLLHCTGLINFYAKQDYDGARRDFESFLAQVPDGTFPRQVAEARQLLDECALQEESAGA
jgi:hypothetical protein